MDFSNGIAHIRCYPEGKTENKFEMALDVNKRQILSISLKNMNAYAAHAAWKIYRTFAEQKSLPQKLSSTWM